MSEPSLNSLRSDLRFVRDAVSRSEHSPIPLHSRLIWSIYCLIGFVLLDLRPPVGSLFLLMGLPVAVGLEWLGTVWLKRRRGEVLPSGGLRELLQMVALVAAVGAVVVLAFRGHLSNGYSLGQMLLVLVGFHMLTVGIWAASPLKLWWNPPLFLGVCLLTGAVVASFQSTGVWTVLGVVQAIVIGFAWRFPMSLSAPEEA